TIPSPAVRCTSGLDFFSGISGDLGISGGLGPSLRFEEGGLHRVQTEHLADGRERAAVDRTGPESLERVVMLAHRVALVLGEAVSGVAGVELAHDSVARGLRDDRRGRDREAQRVAV